MTRSTGPTAEQILALCPNPAQAAVAAVSAEQAARLAEYAGLLVKWNRAMNLVGHSRWRDIWDDLIVDSLYLAPFVRTLELSAEPLCLDLGAGAGLPGVPLRVLWDEGVYRMVDTRAKRTSFLRTVVAKLRLERTEVVQGRAEDALADAREHAEGADMIVSRAFMPWEKMLELVRGSVSESGRVVVMSNEALPDALPSEWRATGSVCYEAGTGRDRGPRWLWALAPTADNAPGQ